MTTPGQRACETMNRYNLSLDPDSPGVFWDALSDEGRRGWEVTAAAIAKRAFMGGIDALSKEDGGDGVQEFREEWLEEMWLAYLEALK